MTGETANGRSTIACTTPRPGNFPRASASAVTTPNTTLMGTTIATISSESWIADCAAGVVTDSQNGVQPFSNVRQKIMPSGTASSSPR